MVGICLRNERFHLVQEYLNFKTLYVRLQQCMGSSSSSTTLMMMKTSEVMEHLLGILEGLELLHSYGFLHPGLSTKKVLLTNKGICKLYDFCLDKDAGSITDLKKSQMQTCGMNQFAPEALHQDEYTKASDVWSTAVVIWEIISETCKCMNAGN
ncbi:Fibroblast growth factor receptor 3 [Holothuria leucospilota]|uniref:Fibroblast growth factor receptor 3 n=1 Tax=Holothuria leucospilota TaxID=206669 RepID=A0A9Q1C4S0_HOLLE|nr:Fibroblast growth factor receptor 3 [Holothuria leucospilota]